MSASSEFKSIFRQSQLEEIYFSSVKFNKSIGVDRVSSELFEKDLSHNISIIQKKATNRTYAFSQFREKLISRGAHRCPRVISIPTIRDKLTLRALFNILYSVYNAKAPFLHKIVTEVVDTVSGNHYDGILRLDVKNFYPSIDHDTLFTELSKKIKKKEVFNLISNSISQKTVAKASGKKRFFNTKGIPQGLSISNILANVYMQPIDRKYAKRKSIRYFRYVDDILIFCNIHKVENIKNEIFKDCKDIGLTLHGDNPDKICTGKLCSGFSYLGYRFDDSVVTVRKKSLNNLRESIIKLLTQYKHSKTHDLKLLSWSINIRITGCIFDETKYGWLFFFSQINDLQLLYSLDHFVKKQLIRFGIDPNKIEIKKFIRVFHEITKNLKRSKYVPNFDLITLKEKRTLLNEYFAIKAKRLNEHQIESLFRQKIFRTVKDLEKDLARIS